MVGRTASYEQFSQGYMLDADTMDYFGGCYLPDGVDRADPRCSPLLADDHAGAAPAVVVTHYTGVLRLLMRICPAVV